MSPEAELDVLLVVLESRIQNMIFSAIPKDKVIFLMRNSKIRKFKVSGGEVKNIRLNQRWFDYFIYGATGSKPNLKSRLQDLLSLFDPNYSINNVRFSGHYKTPLGWEKAISHITTEMDFIFFTLKEARSFKKTILK